MGISTPLAACVEAGTGTESANLIREVFKDGTAYYTEKLSDVRERIDAAHEHMHKKAKIDQSAGEVNENGAESTTALTGMAPSPKEDGDAKESPAAAPAAALPVSAD